MTEKFDKNNNLQSLDQEALVGDNYTANLDKDNQALYPTQKSHKHLKFWSFLILVIFIIFLSGYRFYSNIFDPLKYDVPDWLANQISSEEQAAKTIAELKESDTDQDGLTDYQEIYQYYTSMFLPDTDSDGFTDAEEVNLGQDPVCPIGESCNLLRLITPNTKLSSIIQDINLDADLTVQTAAVAEFRKFLEANGMDKAELDALTDEDLLAIFRIVDESNILDGDQLSASTTPGQIREFLLLLPGVDPVEINAMTDEELIIIAEDLIAK
ncbi:MAG: thrombospondin type 3 repeat-containing protein [Patescibacteria group bacterium]|jgi:hypothetical protein